MKIYELMKYNFLELFDLEESFCHPVTFQLNRESLLVNGLFVSEHRNRV